jgi:hydroxypyruvate isomerase
MSFKQSFSWWCFAGRPDIGGDAAKLLQGAKSIGYDGVDLAPTEILDTVKEHGLEIASYVGHASLTDGLNRRENHQRIAEELHRNIELAKKYGIPNLVCFSGNRNGLDDERGAEITAEGLKLVAKAAEEAGVMLVVELLNSKVDHKDYQCDHTAWGVKVCQLVGSPAVKLLYDIYHMQIMEGDIIRTIRQNIQWIGHMHTAGNPGRNDMDETQELYYPAIARAIKDTGYDRWVGHEFIPKGNDTFAALRHAYELFCV